MYDRILVPLDGSPTAEKVMPHAIAFARQFSASLVLLRVVEPDQNVYLAGKTDAGFSPVPLVPGEDLPHLEAEAKNYLAQMAGRLGAEGVTATYEVVRGSPARAIVEKAKAVDASLIAMTTHARGGIAHLLLGDTAEAVVRRSGRPVLLIHPQ